MVVRMKNDKLKKNKKRSAKTKVTELDPQMKKLAGRVKRSPKEPAAKDPTAMPLTFKFAAETLETMSRRGGSAGSIVVSRYKSYNYKLVYALVMNTIKNLPMIKKIINNLKLNDAVPSCSSYLLEILVGDLLYGKSLETVLNNPIAAVIKSRNSDIVKQQTLLKKECQEDKTSSTNVEAKYIRINHFRSTLEHVLSQLKTVGLTKLDYSKDKVKFKKFINKLKTMDTNEFMLDFHFPNDLIVLKPQGADKLRRTDLIKKGKIMLQDKASYLAVEALDPKPGQKIVDACFAPGGKTCIIANKMKNKGKIFAFDVNKKRLVDALFMLKKQGVTCAKAEVQDFSKVKLRRLMKTNNLEQFDSILIDPSCSGSGINSRADYRKTDHEAGRLKKLQAFQVSLLRHALRSCVAKTIVYCTCSVSVEENEEVVRMALKESGVDKKWTVVDAVPYWPHRGDSSYEFGNKCLRSDSNSLTNGFFIAKLLCNDTSESKEVTDDSSKTTEEEHNDEEEEELEASSEEGEDEEEDEEESGEEETDEGSDEELEDSSEIGDETHSD